jgi:hypothetical protein
VVKRVHPGDVEPRAAAENQEAASGETRPSQRRRVWSTAKATRSISTGDG